MLPPPPAATGLCQLPLEDWVAVNGPEAQRQFEKGHTPHSFNEILAMNYLQQRAPNIVNEEYDKEFRRLTEAMPFFTGIENEEGFDQSMEGVDGEARDIGDKDLGTALWVIRRIASGLKDTKEPIITNMRNIEIAEGAETMQIVIGVLLQWSKERRDATN